MTLALREDDLAGAATQALLALHLAGMQAGSPPGHGFAFDLSGLRTSDVTVWTAWDGDALAGIGALKQHGDGTGELKSMRTHPDHLRKGVATALLERVIAVPRSRSPRVRSVSRHGEHGAIIYRILLFFSLFASHERPDRKQA